MHATEEHPVCLQDGYRNQYYIKKGDVHVQIAHQESRHEKIGNLLTVIFLQHG